MLLNPFQARKLFTHALENGYAVLAVNADSPAAVIDCLEAAREAKAPIIIETSLWQLTGRSFGAGNALRGLASYLVQLAHLAGDERYADLPILFHTDHIKGPETLPLLTSAIRGVPIESRDVTVTLSPSTISLDSSEMTEEENIETILALCKVASDAGAGATLEMEAGVDDGLTTSETAKRLLGSVEDRAPGMVWLWAPGLGTRHGLQESSYPEFSVEAVGTQRQLAKEITGRDIGLALHGSSGLSEEKLREAAKAGVVKVNWSSESLLIRSRAAAEYYRTKEKQLQPQNAGFKAAAMDNGVQSFVSEHYLPRVIDRIALLGGAGRAEAAMKSTLG
jgi:fructose-bisphosphate aldolase class II